MLAINRQMGFRPFIASISWQGSAPAVAQRLLTVAGGRRGQSLRV